MFEHLSSKISDPSMLSPTSVEKLQTLREKFSSLPEDYLSFLQEIGNGNVGGMQIYGGLIGSDFVYPSLAEKLGHVVLFGDDFQGYCFGFDTPRDYQLVEIDPSGETRLLDESFEKFIEDYVD